MPNICGCIFAHMTDLQTHRPQRSIVSAQTGTTMHYECTMPRFHTNA